MKRFEEASVAEDIMHSVIASYGKFLDELIQEAKIICLFDLREKSSDNAHIQIPRGAWEFLVDCDYVIVIYKKGWEEFTTDQQRALVFHELKHVKSIVDEKRSKINWRLKDHDVEEFFDVVQVFGDWSSALKMLEQLKNKKN